MFVRDLLETKEPVYKIGYQNRDTFSLRYFFFDTSVFVVHVICIMTVSEKNFKFLKIRNVLLLFCYCHDANHMNNENS